MSGFGARVYPIKSYTGGHPAPATGLLGKPAWPQASTVVTKDIEAPKLLMHSRRSAVAMEKALRQQVLGSARRGGMDLDDDKAGKGSPFEVEGDDASCYAVVQGELVFMVYKKLRGGGVSQVESGQTKVFSAFNNLPGFDREVIYIGVSDTSGQESDTDAGYNRLQLSVRIEGMCTINWPNEREPIYAGQWVYWGEPHPERGPFTCIHGAPTKKLVANLYPANVRYSTGNVAQLFVDPKIYSESSPSFTDRIIEELASTLEVLIREHSGIVDMTEVEAKAGDRERRAIIQVKKMLAKLEKAKPILVRPGHNVISTLYQRFTDPIKAFDEDNPAHQVAMSSTLKFLHIFTCITDGLNDFFRSRVVGIAHSAARHKEGFDLLCGAAL